MGPNIFLQCGHTIILVTDKTPVLKLPTSSSSFSQYGHLGMKSTFITFILVITIPLFNLNKQRKLAKLTLLMLKNNASWQANIAYVKLESAAI